MAITKLLHVKESKPPHDKQYGMRKLIRYILNPSKTLNPEEQVLYTYSNVGEDADEIIDAFMNTKLDFDKLDGRQAYHFIISLPTGTGDAETIYAMGMDFCKQYLGSGYDYCLGVHFDRGHLHCHIAFNSVNRITGRKYQYSDGDWAKTIQPLTDKIAKDYGQEALLYDKGKKKGRSYGEDKAIKEGMVSGIDILKHDIDYAINVSSDFDEYIAAMQRMGYSIRQGHSDKLKTDYMAYSAPWAGKARRDYKLGDGYSLSDIEKRLTGEYVPIQPPISIPDKLHISNLYYKTNNLFQRTYAKRYVIAVVYHFLPGGSSNTQIRQELRQITQIRDECSYLIDNNIDSLEELRKRYSELIEMERSEKKCGGDLKHIRAEKAIIRHILKRQDEETYADTITTGQVEAVLQGECKEVQIKNKEVFDDSEKQKIELVSDAQEDIPFDPHTGEIYKDEQEKAENKPQLKEESETQEPEIDEPEKEISGPSLF